MFLYLYKMAMIGWLACTSKPPPPHPTGQGRSALPWQQHIHVNKLNRRTLKRNRMFNILEQRFHDIIADIGETLIGMSVDPRLMPNVATNELSQRTVRSSASTPSLRSRDGAVPPHARMDPGGNVRVVVRVRAFLPRGESSAVFLSVLLPGWELHVYVGKHQ